jgi:hypothetical protein
LGLKGVRKGFCLGLTWGASEKEKWLNMRSKRTVTQLVRASREE